MDPPAAFGEEISIAMISAYPPESSKTVTLEGREKVGSRFTGLTLMVRMTGREVLVSGSPLSSVSTTLKSAAPASPADRLNMSVPSFVISGNTVKSRAAKVAFTAVTVKDTLWNTHPLPTDVPSGQLSPPSSLGAPAVIPKASSMRLCRSDSTYAARQYLIEKEFQFKNFDAMKFTTRML